MHSSLKKISSLVWHPFLLTLFALLVLLAANYGRLPLVQTLRPLLVCIMLAMLLLVLFRWLVKDGQRAGLLVSLTLLLFYSYGHVYGLLEGSQLLGVNIGRHRILLVIYALLFILGVALILRCKRSALPWTQWVNLCTLLLVILQLGQLGLAAYENRLLKMKVEKDVTVVDNDPIIVNSNANINRPDIYFIILDTYTRQDAFQQVLGYDNSGFVEDLRARGFTIADCSMSNYNSTSASVLTSLEMIPLDELTPALGQGYQNLIYLDPYLENNRVSATLADLGYTSVVFESGYSPTELVPADVYLTSEPGLSAILRGGLTRYESLIVQSSAGILVYDFSDHLPSSLRYFLDATYVAHRERILFQLDAVGELQDIQSPKFVFAHILAPHTPFVFTSEGLPVERSTPFTLNDDPELIDREQYRQHFIGQTQYINTRVIDLVDRILAQPGDPVIIIQGDHGLPRSGIWVNAILNAIRLPGGEDMIYPSISPVNTFRLVFNKLFDAGLTFAEDRSCRFNRADPTSCTIVVEPSAQCALP
ncbi:MAG: hypothetical protein JW704_09965 [Anaerolineaceae bacterium]|nr:hypothetical protein [Anaerolineaceae bacterium]MBN2678318.1 hypothetical protein [Anaerolineaceae bacterium]